MANAFQENATGGISLSFPAMNFGNTVAGVNSGYSFDLPMATIQAFANNALTFTQNNAANNQAFLSGVISKSSNAVTDTANRGFEFQTAALNVLQNTSTQAQGTLNTALKKRYQCFLTSAVAEKRGLPDDCEELTILRQYRDSFLRKNYPELVLEYYAIAPELCRQINEDKDCDLVFDAIYHIYIRPAVEAVKEGKQEEALSHYSAMVYLLLRRYRRK